jgi:hypothetical protein
MRPQHPPPRARPFGSRASRAALRADLRRAAALSRHAPGLALAPALALALAVVAIPGVARGDDVNEVQTHARLVAPEPVHEFGSVDQGAVVRHEFRFLNAGNDPLEIDEVTAPCGCTAAVLPESIIAPGEEGSIEVAFDTAGFRGRKAKSVFVSTNDPVQPLHSFVLTGDVLAHVLTDPPVLYFGRVHPASGTTGKVRVLSATGEPLRIGAVAVDHPGVRAALEPLPEAGDAGRLIVVTLDGEIPRGPFSTTVRVSVDAPRPGVVELPLIGNVEGDVVVQPSYVTVGTRAFDGRERQRLRIRNLGIEPIAISGVSAPDVPLDYAVRIVRPGYEYQITLHLTRDEISGGQQPGTVHIYTTHPEESEVVVPVYAAPSAS